VCLLIAVSGVLPGTPLLVAANRDERYDRPAEVMTVLRERRPRILGGRDKVAGGTWLAVNSRGLVAGLTNQPSGRPRDDSRRSRGELPLAFAAHPDAATAVGAVCAGLDPSDYNPCWLLVGDRHSLYSVGMAGGCRPVVRLLPPGIHVLENVPLDADSAKARQLGAMVAAGIGRISGINGPSGAAAPGMASRMDGPGWMDDPERALAAVLRDHRPAVTAGEPGTGPQDAASSATGPVRPAELSAACVHGTGYGTRSAMIVSVGDAGLPRVRASDGPPCQAPFQDFTALWTS
jgi:uncharacterized protein with NRDE domain